MKRIAVIGKARSGKTTSINIIKEYYEKQGKIVGCYDVSQALYPITKTLFPDCIIDGENKDREKLQLVGQTIRQYDQNFWINAMDKYIMNDIKINGYKDVILISGVRQFNEYCYLIKNGFKTIKIEALESIRKERAQNNNDKNILETFEHETEKQIDYFCTDFEVRNNGGEEFLKTSIENILGVI